MLSLSSKCAPVLTASPTKPHQPHTLHTHTHVRAIVSHTLGSGSGWGVSDSSIIITIQKVKHTASSLFFAFYVFVPLSLFQLISICKSNHTHRHSSWCSQDRSLGWQETVYVNTPLLTQDGQRTVPLSLIRYSDQGTDRKSYHFILSFHLPSPFITIYTSSLLDLSFISILGSDCGCCYCREQNSVHSVLYGSICSKWITWILTPVNQGDAKNRASNRSTSRCSLLVCKPVIITFREATWPLQLSWKHLPFSASKQPWSTLSRVVGRSALWLPHARIKT